MLQLLVASGDWSYGWVNTQISLNTQDAPASGQAGFSMSWHRRAMELRSGYIQARLVAARPRALERHLILRFLHCTGAKQEIRCHS
jgi:hypothetical protein